MDKPTIDEQIARHADRTTAERDGWKTLSPCELMAGNAALMEYGKHWEGRAETAERQLAELKAKHDALVNWLREPVDEYLNISYLWKKSEDDAEGMDLGHPTQAHYFATLLQQAMTAVALDKGGE